MNNPKRLLAIALAVLALSPLSGCYYAIVPVYTTCMAPQADSRVKSLQEINDNLNERYDNRVIEINKKIATYKLDIDKQLDQSKISDALKSIKSFHQYTHVYQRKVIEHEDIDKGDDFIEDSLDTLMEKVDEQLKKRRFDALEVSLKELDGLQAKPEQLKKLQAQRANVKLTWLNTIISDAKKSQDKTPGAAIIYYAKAAQLAQDIKDQRANELQQQAQTLRAALIKDNAFYVTTEAEGFESAAILKGALNGQHAGQLRFDQDDQLPHAMLSVQLQEPSYTPSTSSGTNSFKYQSGTKQIPNPKIDSINKDIKWQQSKIKDKERDIASYERRIEDQQRCSTGSSACPKNIEDARRNIGYRRKDIQGYNEKISKLEAERAKTSPTISQPVYAQQEYPVTYHHLTGAMNVVVTLNAKGKPLTLRERISHKETDLSHDAHSRNDGSVSADPANPPRPTQVWPGLKSNVQQAINSVLNKGLIAHQATLDKGGDGVEGIHNLATFMLIGPYDKAHSERLDTLTGITNSTALLLK